MCKLMQNLKFKSMLRNKLTSIQRHFLQKSLKKKQFWTLMCLIKKPRRLMMLKKLKSLMMLKKQQCQMSPRKLRSIQRTMLKQPMIRRVLHHPMIKILVTRYNCQQFQMTIKTLVKSKLFHRLLEQSNGLKAKPSKVKS